MGGEIFIGEDGSIDIWPDGKPGAGGTGGSGVEVKHDGRPEFKRELKEAILQGLEECGMLCETYAKKACPVDTGRLRDSYEHFVDEGERVAVVGTNVEYGKFVELGTRRQRAQPHLRPAAADHAAKYAAVIRRSLGG